jgi:hypothetical protein
MDATSICAACGGAGFLLDKVSLFPFVAGCAMGIAFVTAAPELFATLRCRVTSLSKAAAAKE